MDKTNFFSNNRFIIRLELVSKPGVFASVAAFGEMTD